MIFYATAMIGSRMVTKAFLIPRDLPWIDIDWEMSFLEFIRESDTFMLLHVQSSTG
jgi:hypothetical protein